MHNTKHTIYSQAMKIGHDERHVVLEKKLVQRLEVNRDYNKQKKDNQTF